MYNPAVSDNTLKKGDIGTEVKKLQVELNAFGWYDLVLDGSFGTATEKAVKDAQEKLGLHVTGEADYTTIEELKEANKLPSGTVMRTMIVDGKTRQLPGMLIDGWNFVRLKDIDFKFNLADVSYDYDKKLPVVKKK